ncbi:MAG: serine/threonine protein kinase [Muribaculaceae bacterium]|nr:serine/threonine protein kinase [Muribaculaceae bacterium]
METEIIQPGDGSQRHAPLRPGTPLCAGRYHVAGVLGCGGFGITYLAVCVATGERVAIKEFFYKAENTRNPDGRTVSVTGSSGTSAAYRAKFLKEAAMLKSLNHKGIVHVSETFSENGTDYYVMNYVAGATLSQLIKEKGALEQRNARRIINAVSEALSYIHARRITHLDVKPSNIIIDAAVGQPVLIDFGISKHYDSSGNHTTSTPPGISAGYSALEQYSSQNLNSFSPESDIYSLAATLYAMVTGTAPADAAAVAMNGLPELPGNILPEIKEAIKAGMAPRRQDRPSTVLEWVNILNHHNGALHHSHTAPPGGRTPVTPAPPASRPPEKKKRKGCLRAALILMLTALVAATTLTIIAVIKRSDSPSAQAAEPKNTVSDKTVSTDAPASEEDYYIQEEPAAADTIPSYYDSTYYQPAAYDSVAANGYGSNITEADSVASPYYY